MESLSRVSGFSIELFKQLCQLRQAQALPHFAFSFAHLFQISQFYLLMFILRFPGPFYLFVLKKVGLLFPITYISFGFVFLFILKVI